MFIVVKNPPSSPVAFTEVLKNVVDDIYGTSMDAQQDAINLANTNPGSAYAVFQLVLVGSAYAPVVAPLPAAWQAPVILDSPETVLPPTL